MDAAVYRDLLAQARRVTRNAEEARDVLQESLLLAVEAGRSEPAWIAGVLRNRALMLARGSARRRRREAAGVDLAPEQADTACGGALVAGDPRRLLQRLPPAARRLAVLSLHGMSGDEIRWILGLSPAAFRQRLTSIRRCLAAMPGELQAQGVALAQVRDPARCAPLPFGLVRRALKAALRGAALGTHDPDGHLLVLRPIAHISPGGGN